MVQKEDHAGQARISGLPRDPAYQKRPGKILLRHVVPGAVVRDRRLGAEMDRPRRAGDGPAGYDLHKSDGMVESGAEGRREWPVEQQARGLDLAIHRARTEIR